MISTPASPPGAVAKKFAAVSDLPPEVPERHATFLPGTIYDAIKNVLHSSTPDRGMIIDRVDEIKILGDAVAITIPQVSEIDTDELSETAGATINTNPDPGTYEATTTLELPSDMMGEDTINAWESGDIRRITEMASYDLLSTSDSQCQTVEDHIVADATVPSQQAAEVKNSLWPANGFKALTCVTRPRVDASQVLSLRAYGSNTTGLKLPSPRPGPDNAHIHLPAMEEKASSDNPRGGTPDTSLTSDQHAVSASTATALAEGDLTPQSNETWIWKHDGRVWPVVLCGDDILPGRFLLSRHKTCHIPAILLGKRKYIWTSISGLQTYDPSHDYLDGAAKIHDLDIRYEDSEEVKTRKDRHRAFLTDAPMHELPQFWRNVIINAQQARTLERAGRKRKVMDRGTGQDSLFCSKRPRKRPRLNGKRLVLPTPDMRGELDDNDFVRFSATSDHAFPTRYQATVEDAPDQDCHTAWQQPDVAIPAEEQCTFLIGVLSEHFIVHARSIFESDFLPTLAQESSNHVGMVIDLSTYTMTTNDFRPVHAYLLTGTLSPDFLSHFFESDASNHLSEAYMNTYHTASQLHLPALQRLCVRQIQISNSLAVPLPSLLRIGRIFSLSERSDGVTERELQHWLATQMAERFWPLMDTHGAWLSQVLRGHDGLRADVLGTIARSARVGAREGGVVV